MNAQPHNSAHLQFGSCCSVVLLPITIRPRFALVIATFKRRASDRNPTRPSVLHLTALKMMTSFSCPAHVMPCDYCCTVTTPCHALWLLLCNQAYMSRPVTIVMQSYPHVMLGGCCCHSCHAPEQVYENSIAALEYRSCRTVFVTI